MELLRRRLRTATEELTEQADSFQKFSSAQLEHIPMWMEAVSKYEAGELEVNPYSIPNSGKISRVLVPFLFSSYLRCWTPRNSCSDCR